MSPEEREALRLAVDERRRDLEKIVRLEHDPVPPVGSRSSKFGTATSATHGTETAYTNWKCRCDECRAAAAKRRRERRHRAAGKVETYCESCGSRLIHSLPTPVDESLLDRARLAAVESQADAHR